MSIHHYSFVMCEQYNDCDPHSHAGNNAKEARENAKKDGFIYSHKKDFCSESCKNDWLKEKQSPIKKSVRKYSLKSEIENATLTKIENL